MNGFFQDGPRLGNQYDDDALLRSYLRWRLPPGMLDEVEPGLRHLGARAVTDLLPMADDAEANPPRLVSHAAWGRRIDEIRVAAGWRALDRVSAEEGLVATAYERRHGALSRVHQMALLYLFHPSSATYSCPLAMTDGAARFLELHGDARTREPFARLTSRDPGRFWTLGQWMTERTGGSDVGLTTTVAVRDGDGTYRLHGTKWFTSATTSQMAMTLARPEGAPAGGRGLSVFLVELRDAGGRLQGIRVDRLKDKLGTRALPTAELTLDGTPALLVGGEGDGIRKIATLFNVTRVYNAVAAVGGMRRAIALARDYAQRRVAFGRPLAELPLHAATLDDLDVRFHAAFHLTFRVVELMGREECGEATAEEIAMLRLLTPAAKLFTAKQAVIVASEVLEAFGGAGYVEDTGLPRLLRDAQVLPIWEGTTNVLSVDVLRAIGRSGALAPWLDSVRGRLGAGAASLEREAATLLQVADHLERHLAGAASAETLETSARELAMAIARLEAGVRAVEHARATAGAGDARMAGAITRWNDERLAPLRR